MKDRNDELTTEVENLKQASPHPKRPHRQISDMTRIPIREGTVLTDSVRGRGIKKTSSMSSAGKECFSELHLRPVFIAVFKWIMLCVLDRFDELSVF